MTSILDAREKLAALLAPVSDDDPDVHDNIVDALVPPCLVVGWRAPMLEGRSACGAWGALVVMCVGGRIDAAAGVETCERLYDYTETRLRDDASTGWSIPSDSGVILWELANTTYLAVRVDVRVPVEIP